MFDNIDNERRVSHEKHVPNGQLQFILHNDLGERRIVYCKIYDMDTHELVTITKNFKCKRTINKQVKIWQSHYN